MVGETSAPHRSSNALKKKAFQQRKRSQIKQNSAANSRSRIHAEVKDLEARVRLECTDDRDISASAKDDTTVSGQEDGPQLTLSLFSELPISTRTQRALKASNFEHLTVVQRKAIPYGLAGYDVLGEAETGSGKTLAFVIPVLENLYRRLWDNREGLGALIIIPTRELAAQIFDVLKDVGQFHNFSAICLIGGKRVEDEARRIGDMNIVIATPGRLLQHLDESPSFDTSNLVMLVIDEADLLLDMGFSETMEHILNQLPPSSSRQTLLFSATLSAAVHRLVLVSLKDTAKKVTTRSSSTGLVPTADRLKQYFITVPLHDQVRVLFSLLRSRSQKRLIVFVNSCKQVRFLYESFCRLKPGCALFELHGRQPQQKRLDTLQTFSAKRAAACLLCTDVAARGIDFPSVDIVVQLNCPPDVSTYVHRIGRTARYRSTGVSILCLLPSEMAFLGRLAEQQITPVQMFIRPHKTVPIQGKLASLLAANPPIKYLAQRAYISYLRSLRLFKDRQVFNCEAAVEGPDGAQRFAESLGLVSVPQDAETELAQPEKKKKLTKLERLKQKIQLKKEQQQAEGRGPSDDEWELSDGETGRVSKTQRRLDRLRVLRDKCTEDDHNNNEETSLPLFVSSPADTAEVAAARPLPSLGSLLDSADVKRKLRKQQIHIRADGTAKIKGLAMLSSGRLQRATDHVFFEEDENEDAKPLDGSALLKTKTPFEHLVDELNTKEPSVKPSLHETRDRYLDTVRQQLEDTKEMDKARERKRVQLRHLKKRERERALDTSSHDDKQRFEVRLASLSDSDEEHSTSADAEIEYPANQKRLKIDSSVAALEGAALKLLNL